MTQHVNSIAQVVRFLPPICTFWSRLRVLQVHRWALFLTVTGWSLMWAKALALVPSIPAVAAVLIFLVGLVLIPFSAGINASSAPRQPDTDGLARTKRAGRA
jgi:hypothetical protein